MLLRLISVLGVLSLVGMAWGLSSDRTRFPFRAVLWGLGLQFLLALLILRTPFGEAVFGLAQQAVARLIEFATEGAAMVFGPLADADLLTEHWGAENSYIFVITVSATIIVVSAISALLYHWGVLQAAVRASAWVMRRAMGTSGSESLAAAANIFMGMTEAPLVVRPYLARMTRSELLALMTGGMATIAGGVLVAYVSFGVPAGHLVTASVMSAPAALMVAKIMIPEVEVSETLAGASAGADSRAANGIDALCRGASDGMKMALNVMAMLIAFVAVVALVNFLLTFAQRKLCDWTGLAFEPVTLQTLFGVLNAPFAFLFGVPWEDCRRIGATLGERLVLNEFVGYYSLAQMHRDGLVSERGFTLASYALCGFANFGSVAIQIGGIGALTPERRADLARLGLRAMVGGLLACYLTAAMVGILI